MVSCFPAEHLAEFVNLCEVKESSVWDAELGKTWTIIVSVLFGVGCFVYYLIIWAETDEQGSETSTKMKIKHRNKHKYY